jgi:hypothetical protein
LELDGVKIYELIDNIREEITNVRIDVAVVKNNQDRMSNDIVQLKNEVSNIKQYNNQEIGEKSKSGYIKDKLLWPIVVLVISVVINPILSNLTRPLAIPNANQNQQIQVTPTPTPTINKV